MSCAQVPLLYCSIGDLPPSQMVSFLMLSHTSCLSTLKGIRCRWIADSAAILFSMCLSCFFSSVIYLCSSAFVPCNAGADKRGLLFCRPSAIRRSGLPADRTSNTRFLYGTFLSLQTKPRRPPWPMHRVIVLMCTWPSRHGKQLHAEPLQWVAMCLVSSLLPTGSYMTGCLSPISSPRLYLCLASMHTCAYFFEHNLCSCCDLNYGLLLQNLVLYRNVILQEHLQLTPH